MTIQKRICTIQLLYLIAFTIASQAFLTFAILNRVLVYSEGKMGKDSSSYYQKVSSLFDDAREKTFPKNQIICYQGDTLSFIYLVKKGYVKAYTILDSGDTRTMFILGPGDIFPIAFSLTLDWSSYQIRYFYQALTDSALMELDQDNFKALIETNSKNKDTYLHYMAASNEAIMDQLEVMKNKTAKNKVELLLPYLVGKIGVKIAPKTYRLSIKPSHQEIADLSGVTRETMTSLLKTLEEEGVVTQKRSTWIVRLKQTADKDSLG